MESPVPQLACSPTTRARLGWHVPPYGGIALAFWAIHLGFRLSAGRALGITDILLPALMFCPWLIPSVRWRAVVSTATYFAVYYVAFVPLLDDITQRARWLDVPSWEAKVFGPENPVALVQRFRTPLLNVFFCVGYSLHIANVWVPLAWFLLRRDTLNAARFSWAFLACGYLGFAIYLLYPVVPPRLALEGVTAVAPPWGAQAWETAGRWFRANPYAAMPSLHCAFPFLSFLFLRAIRSRLRWAFAWMSLWLMVGTVYLGEHYISDVLAALPVAWVGARVGLKGGLGERP